MSRLGDMRRRWRPGAMTSCRQVRAGGCPAAGNFFRANLRLRMRPMWTYGAQTGGRLFAEGKVSCGDALFLSRSRHCSSAVRLVLTTADDVSDDVGLRCDDNDDTERSGTRRVVGGSGRVADGQRLHTASLGSFSRRSLPRWSAPEHLPAQQLVRAGGLRERNRSTMDDEEESM